MFKNKLIFTKPSSYFSLLVFSFSPSHPYQIWVISDAWAPHTVLSSLVYSYFRQITLALISEILSSKILIWTNGLACPFFVHDLVERLHSVLLVISLMRSKPQGFWTQHEKSAIVSNSYQSYTTIHWENAFKCNISFPSLLKAVSLLFVCFRTGGIVPPVAQQLHRENIQRIVEEALSASGVSPSDLSAIATTIKPGLALSLGVGLSFSVQLVNQFKKPFIPIHHMEAHALTIRLTHKVEFPFLVLLISGGHCLLALVQSVSDFLLLGKSLDIAPGDMLDKVLFQRLFPFPSVASFQPTDYSSRQIRALHK